MGVHKMEGYTYADIGSEITLKVFSKDDQFVRLSELLEFLDPGPRPMDNTGWVHSASEIREWNIRNQIYQDIRALAD